MTIGIDRRDMLLVLNQRQRPVLDIPFAGGSDYFPSLITFTRASAGYYKNSAGVWTAFATDAPRVGDRGLLIEGARTNSFLNSDAPASHTSPALGTGTFTLWCEGAGSVEVAANTASGSGFDTATEGSPVTFTISGGGTVDFTVTGDVDLAQCENGAYPTSFILTAGSAVTRAADVATMDTADIAGFSATEGTLCVDLKLDFVGAFGSRQACIVNDGSGTNNNWYGLGASAPANAPVVNVNSDGGSQVNLAYGSGYVPGQSTKVAFGVRTDDFAGALGGAIFGTDTSGAMPVATLTKIHLGRNAIGTGAHLNGFIRRVRYWPQRLPNDVLRGLTA